MNSNKSGKTWRLVAIILVGLTAAMNLLGGIGTTCAAFFTKKYPPMWSLIDFQWLYQAFVVITTLVGLAGIWTLVKLIKGSKSSYKNALIVLVVGGVINVIHVVVSILLRGKATPADMVMAINLVTLALFAYLGTPGMRNKVCFDKKEDPSKPSIAGSVAAIVCGMVVLSTPFWAGPTHQFQGTNWVDVLMTPLLVSGFSLLAGGSFSLLITVLKERKFSQEPSQQSETTSAI